MANVTFNMYDYYGNRTVRSLTSSSTTKVYSLLNRSCPSSVKIADWKVGTSYDSLPKYLGTSETVSDLYAKLGRPSKIYIKPLISIVNKDYLVTSNDLTNIANEIRRLSGKSNTALNFSSDFIASMKAIPVTKKTTVNIAMFPLPHEIVNAAAVEYSNTIAVFGSSMANSSTSFYLTGTGEYYFGLGKDIPNAFYQGCAVVYNNDVYLVGGCASTTAFYKYDGTSWTKLPDVPFATYGGVCVIYDNKINIIGGGPYESSRKSHYVYDESSSSWSRVSTLLASIYGCCGVSYNGKIWLFGSSYSDYAQYIQIWDGSNWAYGDSTSVFNATNGCAVVKDDKIHILGGYDPYAHYTIDSSYTQTELNNLPYKFKNGCAVASSIGNIHLIGGSASNTSNDTATRMHVVIAEKYMDTTSYL